MGCWCDGILIKVFQMLQYWLTKDSDKKHLFVAYGKIKYHSFVDDTVQRKVISTFVRSSNCYAELQFDSIMLIFWNILTEDHNCGNIRYLDWADIKKVTNYTIMLAIMKMENSCWNFVHTNSRKISMKTEMTQCLIDFVTASDRAFALVVCKNKNGKWDKQEGRWVRMNLTRSFCCSDHFLIARKIIKKVGIQSSQQAKHTKVFE